MGQSDVFFVKLGNRLINVRYLTSITIDKDGSSTLLTTSRSMRGDSVRIELEPSDTALLLHTMEKRGVIEDPSKEP